MLKKATDFINSVIESQQKAKEDRERILTEKREELEKAESIRTQVEKDRLMLMNDKEILVEAILLLQHHKRSLTNVEDEIGQLSKKIDDLVTQIHIIDSKFD